MGMLKKIESESYTLQTRKWGSGTTILEKVADALEVPIGYLLAGSDESALRKSIFWAAIESGAIKLQDELRPGGPPEGTLADFYSRLPEAWGALMQLPLHSYKNQFAFAIVDRVERIFNGCEHLVVNEPPYIFWQQDDAKRWASSMLLDKEQSSELEHRFQAYQSHFRDRAISGKKHYSVTINWRGYIRFLRAKRTQESRESTNHLLSTLNSLSNFEIVFWDAERQQGEELFSLNEFTPRDIQEHEVVGLAQELPRDLANTVAVQILQTPRHIDTGCYLVAPMPTDPRLVQAEISRIDEARSEAVVQYRKHAASTEAEFSSIECTTDKLIKLAGGACP